MSTRCGHCCPRVRLEGFQSGAFMDKDVLSRLWGAGMYPYYGRSAVPSASVVRMWRVWCDTLGLDAGWLDGDPWIPVGMVGPLFVFGHWSADKAVDDGAVLPSWFSGRCLVQRDYYDRCLAVYRESLAGVAFKLGLIAPADALPEKKPEFASGNRVWILDWLLARVWASEQDAGVSRTGGQSGVLPDGWAEACDFLVFGGGLVDVGDIMVPSELANVLPDSFVVEQSAVVFYGDDSSLYVASPVVSGVFLDQLFMMLPQELKDRDLRVARCSSRMVQLLLTGLRNRPVEHVAAATSVDDVHVVVHIMSDQVRDVNPKQIGLTAPKFVSWVLWQALSRGASDIHFEGVAGSGRVRLRVDTGLVEIARIPHALMAPVVSLIRGWSGPGCSEDIYKPGDGRFSFRMDNQSYDVRVATAMAGSGGYSYPMLDCRLLSKTIRRLDAIGFSEVTLGLLRRLARLPQGMIVLTGPTGSGKTSTLYSVLQEVNTPDVKIITAEDPIEIEMDGVNQLPVNRSREVTFSTLLRASLRLDPDIILLGEIRDRESADIAIEAAQTGHLVFTTLHTNTGCEVVERLLGLGVEPYLLGSNLRGVSGQRLEDRLCPRCRRAVPVTKEHRDVFRSAGMEAVLGDVLYEPCGCPHCRRGYSGSVLIAELFPILDAARDLIVKRALARGALARELERFLQEQGRELYKQDFLSLYQDGLRHVALGDTSLEKIRPYDPNWLVTG